MTLDTLEGDGRVAFRYAGGNPNGSARDIAGVLSQNGRVLGMMPHPERAIGGTENGEDGLGVFQSLVGVGLGCKTAQTINRDKFHWDQWLTKDLETICTVSGTYDTRLLGRSA